MSASAAGSVRLALLSIAFRSAGLPDDYAQARFVLWLQQKGYFAQVKHYIEGQGETLAGELSNLYVSPLIADGLLLAYPDFAGKASEARGLIKAQFPKKDDISDDEMLSTLEAVLELQQATPGRLPLTLLIFDELQQFIGGDSARTLQVQEVVQACTSRFQSRLLFIGTGQSALQSNPQLSKLTARFTVKVVLEESDVDRVVRQVVLRKKQNEIPQLQTTLESVRGEIDRHLAGSRIGPVSQDAEVLTPDYPLLPTRRRFWERVLKAIDIAGTAGQLRTQLRMVHEANRMVAEASLGTVVPADLIFEQQEASMQQSGVLQHDLATMIKQMEDGSSDGKLRARLCRLIFLIGKLPNDGPNATGLKATSETLADLMIDDLKTGSASLRQRIPDLLQNLVERGTLLQIESEYRLQTRESADWEEDFRRRLASARADDARMSSERSEILKKAVTDAVRGIALVQGNSRVPRKYRLEFGPDLPRIEGESIPVWVQDEWSTSERSLREAAQMANVDSPLVFVLIRKRDADELRENMAAC
ncbi:MAG: BREX system P-loop protein BrxC, partial [Chloroflexota bacterium]